MEQSNLHFTHSLSPDTRQFAVLIDSENVSSKYADSIFKELSVYGFGAIRRIYGNWSKTSDWGQNVLVEHAIIPIHQFAYTSGKNSSDMLMVIDAMDILYSNQIDGFCLVTSDSDFTRLVMRLREAGKTVIGMGESKTPLSLTRACNKFIHLNLISEETAEPAVDTPLRGVKPIDDDQHTIASLETIEKEILSILSNREEPLMALGGIGSQLSQRFPDFDVRNYGYTKFVTFLKEAMPNSIRLVQKGTSYYAGKNNELTKEELEQAVLQFIRSQKTVNNLGNIVQHLTDRYPQFDLNDYGYSRISSFLRNIPQLQVTNNTVRLRK